MALLDRAFGELTKLGYSPAQAAGVLGNLKIESGLDPNAVGDNGTSYGLAQWHKDRKTGLANYAASHGMSQADPLAQIHYLDWELKNREPTAYKALRAANTPQDAAAAFLHFERPQGYTPDNPLGSMGASKRVAAATGLYSSLSGQAPITGSAPVLEPSFQPSGMMSSPSHVAETIPNSPDISPSAAPAILSSEDVEIATGNKSPDIRGLLASLMPEPDQGGGVDVPKVELPGAGVKRGRGLAFNQLKIKTPSFRRTA